MADAKTEPPVNEPPAEEIQGTPIVPDEVSDWGNDVTFTEPKVKTEAGDEVERGEEAETSPADTPDKTTAENVPTAPPVSAPPATVPDPGEFKPQDYSFEVPVKGKPVKVTSVEEADALAADPDNFETPQQLMQFMRLSQKMENGIERDKAAWQQSRSEFDRQQETIQQRQDKIETISAEINYLQQRGDLPPVAREYADADWTDPLVAKQPGVREQLALLQYMDEENERRQAAGLKSTVTALDAFIGWQIEQAKAKADKDNRTAGEQRKAAGAKVAGSGPAPISNRPKGIAVGRILGDLNGLGSNWN